MNRSGFTTRTPAAAMLAAAAASGLILAGCGSSSGTTTASTSSSGSGQPAASGSAPAARTSGSGSSGSVSTGSGAVAFFPLSVGNKWVYVDKLSGEQGSVTNQVISVTPVASGSKVVMKDQDDLAAEPPTGPPQPSSSTPMARSRFR